MVARTLILLGVGLVTGTVTAMSAGSGVMIVVPFLVLLLDYSIHQAIGVSLLVDVITSVNVAYNYYRFGHVNFRAGAWLALGAVVGAQIGSFAANHIPQDPLTDGFSIFVIITGLIFWLRAEGKAGLNLSFLRPQGKKGQALLTAAIGLYIGVMTGLFGSGGGVTILLALVYILGFPLHCALGTATALMAVTAASGVVGYSLHGQVVWLDGLLIGLAAMASGFFFTRVAHRASERALSRAVGSIFILVGVLMTLFENGGSGLLLATLGK